MVNIGNIRFEGNKSLVLKVKGCWGWWSEVLGVGGGFSLSIEGFHQSAPHLKGKRQQGQSCCEIEH